LVLVIWIAVVARWPGAWVLALPACLPVLNFSPWTGWVGIDELDLFLLATYAGAYTRLALRPHVQAPSVGRLEALALVGVVAVVATGAWRAIADAAAPLSWFQGQADALNTVRVAKSFAHALLLWPLARSEWHADAQRASRRFAQGMVIGATALTCAVLWERAAMPGLFDLAAPYRTVGLFWEMHVGGAAIDAYVVLATPFVAWALWSARGRWHWLCAAVLCVLWAYAVFTTFSRGAYVGAAVGLLILSVRLPLAGGRPWWSALRAGAAAVGVGVLLTVVLNEWGYPAAAALLALLGAWLGWRWHARGRTEGRRLARALLVVVLLAEAAIMLGPDSFMHARLTQRAQDYESRTAHWTRGLDLRRSVADHLFGLGWGRLPHHYDRFAPRGEFPGRVQWRPASASDSAHARLSGPRTRQRIAGLYALTQRVEGAPPYQLAMNLRADRPLLVHARVCESHLLYDGSCQAAIIQVKAAADRGGAWARHQAQLVGPSPSTDRSITRMRVFSLTVLTVGGEADIDDVQLVRPSGAVLLVNGDFDRGGAAWLPAAQSYFVPWHIDNLALDLLIEGGWLALAVALALLAATARRLLGPAADAPVLAPCLAASLGGLLCLGLVSSVLDMPRVALLASLLLALSHLPGRTPSPTVT
jgi:hypothetical protein